MTLREIYRAAAHAAHADGVDPGNEEKLVAWIRGNCRYEYDKEFFLVLGIGCELADIRAREQGFQSEVHRAFSQAEDFISEWTNQ